MGELLVLLLYLALIILLVFLGLMATGASIIAGVVSSIFVSFVSAIKSCALGIKNEVTNLFIKIVLFIILGLFVFIIVAPVLAFIVLIILSICGVI